uniref:Putative chemosensory protein 6 n=1 Tax=Conopomorpha sinensis TaxID=940481 RepID=A0A5Q2USY3_9NEOP|nr:putative chemosensory protein 6 [Conopomorpha sinensis]
MTIRNIEMMQLKFFFLLCCAAVALAQDKYTGKYDNIDLDEILQNRRLLLGYSNCVLDKGPCNAEGKELRSHLEEAINDGCSKCTDAQKKGANKVIDHLIKNELDIWREMTAKFDPDGNFRRKYEAEAVKRGIIIPEEGA